MQVEDFIEATNQAETPEQVFALYEQAVGAFGLDRIMYSALSDHPIYDAVNSPCVMRNYPDSWIQHYVERDYINKDPVRRQGLSARHPFTWRQMMKTRKLARDEKLVMLEAEEAGLRDGVGIALHGPYGEVMGVGMASSAGGVEAERFLPVLHALTVQFHSAYTALALPELVAAQQVRLTPREREVLQWCARGKSNWAIGEILNISEHGVEFHVRNILTKLNADSRITAVVKALRLGLISH